MARVFSQAEARTLVLPGRSSREIVSGEQGARGISLRLVEIAPRKPGEARRGPHVHRDFEECMHVLAGEGITQTEGAEHVLKAGDTILVPAGELHVTHNTGTAPLQLLCFFPVGDVAAGTQEYAAWDDAKAAG